MSASRVVVSFAVAALLGAGAVQAEPMWLSRQYNRCTSCHHSPTGGGLLTPYGRSLSRQELSTTGRTPAGMEPRTEGGGEESFLFGALGDTLGPLSLGVDLRPSHLHTEGAGVEDDRDFFMNADLLAAWRSHGWTLYGELGRQPRSNGTKIDSYEYWVGYQGEKLGFRVGRFLPAYGVRLADHTAYTRSPLGLDSFDQVYGLELSRTGERLLVQISLGPGRADSIIDDDGRHAFTATARVQRELRARSVLVFSGLYRAEADDAPSSRGGGVAFGIAPISRLTI